MQGGIISNLSGVLTFSLTCKYSGLDRQVCFQPVWDRKRSSANYRCKVGRNMTEYCSSKISLQPQSKVHKSMWRVHTHWDPNNTLYMLHTQKFICLTLTFCWFIEMMFLHIISAFSSIFASFKSLFVISASFTLFVSILFCWALHHLSLSPGWFTSLFFSPLPPSLSPL